MDKKPPEYAKGAHSKQWTAWSLSQKARSVEERLDTLKEEESQRQDSKEGMQTILNKEHMKAVADYPHEDGLAAEPFKLRQTKLITE